MIRIVSKSIYSFICSIGFSLLVTLAPSAVGQPVPWLRARGTVFVDSAGKIVVLRGFNLGGAFVMEPWLTALDLNPGSTGLPAIRDDKSLFDVLTTRFGPGKSWALQRAWRVAWASPRDIKRLADAGANVVRIPFWYQNVEDDARPGKLVPERMKLLDDLVDACAANRVYAILDLHGAPGGQSDKDHTGEMDRNELFRTPQLQARTAALWAALARHYRDRPEVAGYDLLNEPMGAPDAAAIVALHDKLYKAIRQVDARHVIIMEDGYKGDAAFPVPAKKAWANVCYSRHIYNFNATSIDDHRKTISIDLPKLRKKQMVWNVPIYVGEFSTITEKQGGVAGLAEYFAAFNKYGWSWTPWTYKHIDANGGLHTVWGLYSNREPWDRANPFTDGYETLLAKFGKYDTSDLEARRDYLDAFTAAAKH